MTGETDTSNVESNCGGFDYTKWQHGLFQDMSLEELTEKAVEFEKAHPHVGKGKRL